MNKLRLATRCLYEILIDRRVVEVSGGNLGRNAIVLRRTRMMKHLVAEVLYSKSREQAPRLLSFL